MPVRKLLPALAAAAALGISTLGVPAAQAQEKKQLVISLWGFNGDKIEEHVLAPFKAKENVEIVLETGNNADRLNKVKIRGGSDVDVIYLTDAFSQTGIDEGLFMPIDKTKVPNMEGLYEVAKGAQGDYGPAYTVGNISIVYDASKVKPITKWEDLWREDLKGQIALPEISTTGGPLMVIAAAKAAGVNPYEQTDEAFAKLAELRPSVAKAYKSGSELINLFSTGEATVGITQDFVLGRLSQAVPSVEFADLDDGSFAVFNTVNVVANSDNKELAQKFVNWVLDPELQKTLAVERVDAPIVASVELTDEEAKGWTYGEAQLNKLTRVDYSKLNAAKTDWADRWIEIFGQ